MSRSGYFQQQCKCGSDRRAAVSVTIAGSTLRTLPRKKSRAITVYLCAGCLRTPARKTRTSIVAAVIGAGNGAIKQ